MTIEIRTTQNVTIVYELAGLRERALAFLLDVGIITFAGILIYWLLRSFIMLLIGMMYENPDYNPWWDVFLNGVLTFGFFLYFILFEILRRGQTPGKMAMQTKVVRLDGKDPEWGDVTLRALLLLPDALFSLGVVGGLLIKTTAKAQRLGDMAADTTVIKLQSSAYTFRLADILNISSLENYQPLYPQVRELSEQDMIFVKNVLVRLNAYPNQAHQELIEDLVTQLMPLLGIEKRPPNRVEFLRTLLKDYIVLTR